MAHVYPFVLEALGWSLIDSLIKFGLLSLAYGCFTANGKWFTASVRQALAGLLLAIGTLWSLLGVVNNYRILSSGGERMSAVLDQFPALAMLQSLMPYMSLAYLVTILFFFVRLCVRYFAERGDVMKKLQPADTIIYQMLEQLQQRIGLPRKVQVWLSENVTTPFTIGVLRPMIILPVAMLNHLTAKETESIIAHELFHIRRYDYLINILLASCGVLFFFNPFTRYLKRIIEKEREQVCDDRVVALGCDRWVYAHALYSLARHDAAPNLALAAAGSHPQLLERVQRILQPGARRPGRKWRIADIKLPAVSFFCLFGSIFMKEPRIDGSFAPSAAAKHLAIIKVNTLVTARPVVIFRPAGAFTEPTVWRIHSTPGSARRRPGRQSRIIPRFDPPVAPSPDDLQTQIIHSFASTQEKAADFTLVIPAVPNADLLQPLIDRSLPFVPSGTFYYAITDSATHRRLTIVHL